MHWQVEGTPKAPEVGRVEDREGKDHGTAVEEARPRWDHPALSSPGAAVPAFPGRPWHSLSRKAWMARKSSVQGGWGACAVQPGASSGTEGILRVGKPGTGLGSQYSAGYWPRTVGSALLYSCDPNRPVCPSFKEAGRKYSPCATLAVSERSGPTEGMSLRS